MRTKLLKVIRRDHRFTIEHKFGRPGFENSGWWFLTDNKLHKSVKHKRLINVLNEYKKLYMIKLLFLWLCRIVVIISIYICINVLF